MKILNPAPVLLSLALVAPAAADPGARRTAPPVEAEHIGAEPTARDAVDDPESLEARLEAVRRARPALSGQWRALLANHLEEARLLGALDARATRKSALQRAERIARKKLRDKKTAKHLKKARKADAALRKLTRSVERAERAAPEAVELGKVEAKLAKKVKKSLRSYRAIGDDAQRSRARVTLLRHRALADELKGKRKESRLLARSKKLLRSTANTADASLATEELRRARSRWYARAGRWTEAARESLLADRASPRSTTRAYSRSRDTAGVCREALAHDVDCAAIEVAQFGRRSFYDFSVEQNRRFSAARADAVKAEYGPLVTSCLAEPGAKGANVSWRVDQDGRVRTFRVDGALDATDLEPCLEAAFAQFRYPSFVGASPTLEVAEKADNVMARRADG